MQPSKTFVACVLVAVVGAIGCGGGTNDGGSQQSCSSATPGCPGYVPPCPSTTPGCPGYVAPDYAASYVGAWTGQSTFVINSVPSTSTIKVPVEEVSTNVIRLRGFCSTGAYSDGPLADVTSSGFTVRGGGSCTFSTTSCSTFVFGVASGTGSVSNGVFTLNLNGTLSCNGTSMSYTMSFTSHQWGSYGSLVATTDGSEGAVGALEALSAAFE